MRRARVVPGRPATKLERTATGNCRAVRLSAPWRDVPASTTLGFVIARGEGFDARFFVRASTLPSQPCGSARSAEEAVRLVVDAWLGPGLAPGKKSSPQAGNPKRGA